MGKTVRLFVYGVVIWLVRSATAFAVSGRTAQGS